MSKAKKQEKKAGKENRLKQKIENKDTAYVLFYATWCPFSQRFLPVFEEFSKTKPDQCEKIIVDEEPELCELYEIEYYPTVLMFKEGEVQRRLDPEPHVGLDKKQLKDFTAS